MKLYRIDYNDENETPCFAWCGTQAAAKARVKELENKYERWRVGNAVQVEVPTDKPSLLAWLNEHCTLEPETTI